MTVVSSSTVVDQGIAAHDNVERRWAVGHIGAKLGLDQIVVKLTSGRFLQHADGEVHADEVRGEWL